MDPPSDLMDTSHVDWAFLPPTALHVIGTLLPTASLLRARQVNKHWCSCLVGVVDTLYIVPEYFLTEASTREVPKAFPKATIVNLDLQDTFMAVPKEIKESLDRYAAERGRLQSQPSVSEAGGSGGTGAGSASGQPVDALQGAAPAAAGAPPQAEAALAAPGAPGPAPPPQAPAVPAPPGQQQQQQQDQHPIAALAAAFAAGLINGPDNVNAAIAAANAVAPAQPAAAPAAAAPAVPQPPPTFPHSAIPAEPLPGVVPPGATCLRVRMPETVDIAANHIDVPTTWDYVASLLSNAGPKLKGLSLSTAPDAAHISMLSPLTHLTSLTMDEASHSTWSADHLPIVGSLTNLRNLAIKIPPFRPARPEPPGTSVQQPLASWTALQQLTKLHVSALRYTFHSSLVSVLPSLTKLEYLALRAPQTRLPWPGSDKPLFARIGGLTGLTQLSLALGDHNMMPQDWQSLTTLGRLSSIELSIAEGSDGLNVPGGLDFPALRSLKLRYPNSQDLVRIGLWSGLQRLDIKFPEHEREWHQEDAVLELLDFRTKVQPSAGAAVIAAVLDNAPAALNTGADGAPAAPKTTTAAMAENVAAALQQVVAIGAAAPAAGSPGAPAAGSAAPTGAGNTAGLTAWWSPLLPLLALPNLTDFRCSAKEGLASQTPILFDEVLSGMCAAWPGLTRLCFKGWVNVASQPAGWDSLRALTKLQQLELRHHPPNEEENQANQANRDPRRSGYVRVEPIKLPAVSLPDSLQTLLLENVELRRKETDCLTNLTSLERRTTCRHFPEFEGMPLQRLVVSNCCVKAKGITSIATECTGLTQLVFAVYKVTEQADLRELQGALRQMVRNLRQLQVLKVRVLAGCITQDLVQDMVTYLAHLQRLKLTSSDGWSDTSLFLPLTRMPGLRKCSLAYFKSAEAARLLRAEFRAMLPYCKIKAKHEA